MQHRSDQIQSPLGGQLVLRSERAARRLVAALVAGCLAASVILLIGALGPGAEIAKAQVVDPCDPLPPGQNAIVCENSKTGQPAERVGRQRRRATPNIQGFATDISVDHGADRPLQGRHHLNDYRLDIYRMGYYGGNGARKVATVQPRRAAADQPACLHGRRHRADRLRQLGRVGVLGGAGGRRLRASTSPSSSARTAASGGSHIFFIVRDDDGDSDLLFQTSDTTWQAYNQYGGNSLYDRAGPGRTGPGLQGQLQPPAHHPRPDPRGLALQRRVPDGPLAGAQRLRRQLLHRGRQPTASGAEILEQRRSSRSATTSTGPATQRANVEAARDAGVNLAFFSGNEIFWKTRWENSIDGSDTDHRTLVCYKETHADAKIDPSRRWTGTWREPARSTQEGGRARERAHRDDVQGQLRHLRDRGACGGRQDAPLAQHQHRHRSHRRPDRDARRQHPRLRVGRGRSTTARARLGWSTSPRPRGTAVEVLQDNGSTYGPGPRPTT